MKRFLMVCGVVVLTSVAYGAMQRGQVTTSGFSREALTNETAAGWRAKLGVGEGGSAGIDDVITASNAVAAFAASTTNGFTTLARTNPATVVYTNQLPGLTNGFVVTNALNQNLSTAATNPASAFQPANANLTNWASVAPSAKQDALGYAPQYGSSNLTNWDAITPASKQNALGYTPATNSYSGISNAVGFVLATNGAPLNGTNIFGVITNDTIGNARTATTATNLAGSITQSQVIGLEDALTNSTVSSNTVVSIIEEQTISADGVAVSTNSPTAGYILMAVGGTNADGTHKAYWSDAPTNTATSLDSGTNAGDMLVWGTTNWVPTQLGRFLGNGATTNATTATLATLTIPSNYTATVSGIFTASGQTNSASWSKASVFRNDSGVISLVGSNQLWGMALNTATNWDAKYVSSGTTNIVVQGTGSTNCAVKWLWQGAIDLIAVHPALFTATNFSDSFNRADGSLGTDWRIMSGSLAISGNKATTTGASSWNLATYTNLPCHSLNQYAYIQLVGFESAVLLLRRDFVNDEHFWIQFNDSANTIVVIKSTVADGDQTLDTSAAISGGLTDTDYVAVTVTGTGASTVIRVWRNPGTSTPGDPTGATWNGASPIYSYTASTGTAWPGGDYIGFGGYDSGLNFDNFSGGGL